MMHEDPKMSVAQGLAASTSQPKGEIAFEGAVEYNMSEPKPAENINVEVKIPYVDPTNGAGNEPGAYLPAAGTVCDQTDTKDVIEELCPVCGDKVSGYHYGLLTCESCKGFFKRTVQNKKVYTCVAERACHIDKTQRKRCPFCRFQKCLDVGMKLEAVRADRMRGGRNKFGPMYKRDRARKLQMMRQRQIAVQTLRGSLGDGSLVLGFPSPYASVPVKQEIQIPQVSSLTSSPESSPGPALLAAQSQAAQAPPPPAHDKWETHSPHSASPDGFAFEAPATAAATPSSTAEPTSTETLRVSPMIREFVQTIDDREWQNSLFGLLQSQTYNQCEVDLFELMCKVLDQNLFSQVDWARNTVFFKYLKVDDQMKLLQNSWSDMLVLDHLHQRMHNGLPDETTLHNGQKFDLLSLGLLGVPSLADHFNELQNKLSELKFDVSDYICVKFLLLLNPEVRGIVNSKCVRDGYHTVQAALLDYTLTCYPTIQDKFGKLVLVVPEIHALRRGARSTFTSGIVRGRRRHKPSLWKCFMRSASAVSCRTTRLSRIRPSRILKYVPVNVDTPQQRLAPDGS
ncbi:LOW QUALITY PROTEIN: nuclear hormone receptor FTZ-F1 [Maniola jurtina]|uniref:LOW QUALITY PROTEIN: nuclear hormone receptor FTZ-F1 n=1 Tax=Maniola jurtina TaxID=191418 RepID=UPI001E68E997|nr:LOW QUALITY PROTEIN: nuclear hormone receptor FTZ-F1 [Maniola jurtina]